MTTVEGLFFLALAGLALGLTIMSTKANFLPLSIGASIAWLTISIAFTTEAIGPGFGDLWVEVIVLVSVLMTFAPLLTQMTKEVKNEVRLSGRKHSWITSELSGWDPTKKSPYEQRRQEIRDLGTSTRRRRKSK